ncbi:MAG: S24 family peptidase [FCB group bacterium]|jgi:DNA polymerase V
MKVKKVVELNTHYSFEAPIFPAGKHDKVVPLDDLNAQLDLNHYLVPNPKNIFLVRVSGESMIDKNILDGDILIVDKKERPKNGKIVIASLDGEMTVKTFSDIDGKISLISANKNFFPIEIDGFMEFQIQGVVKHVIRPL